MSKFKKLMKRWFIDGFSGMAMGLFCTLLIGLIVKQIGTLFGSGAVSNSLKALGNLASSLMGAGIGAGVAKALKANKLTMFSSIVAGFLGAHSASFLSSGIENGIFVPQGSGEPVGAFFASLLSVEVGNLLEGKTKVDIILVPLAVLLSALVVAVTICPLLVKLMNFLGEGIQKATTLHPIPMGLIISIVMGCLLTLPTSSAAIAISLKLGGIAGGAAVVGCCCHMIGFAVMSYRENKVAGLIAQGLGTSMLQIPNIFKKPILILPPVIASGILGIFSTTVFKLSCDFMGSGMGTSGLVGIFSTITGSSGTVAPFTLFLGIALLMFIMPALICFAISEIMRKKGLIKENDLKLDL